MANGYKGDVARLVNSDYLYQVLKLEDDRVKAKLKDEIYTTKTITVVDTPENYVVCSSSDLGALEVVDDSAVPTATQVKLSTVQAFVPTAAVGEYYQHIAEVSHDEPYEDTIYRKKDESYSSTDVDEKIKEVNDRITEVASGGLKPLEMATYRTFFDNLVITADGYVEPQP